MKLDRKRNFLFLSHVDGFGEQYFAGWICDCDGINPQIDHRRVLQIVFDEFRFQRIPGKLIQVIPGRPVADDRL